MKRRNPLAGMGVVAAILQTERIAQFGERHAFEPLEDGLLAHGSARNQPITVIALCNSEYVVGCYRLPQGDVIHRREPLFHVFDVLEHNHINIVPQRCFETQFYRMKESTV